MSVFEGIIFTLLVPVLHVAGFFLAIHAIMSARTAQGSAAWAVSLVMLPYLAIPLYLIAGRSRLLAYVESRRACDAQIEAISPQSVTARSVPGEPSEPLDLLQSIGRLVRTPVTRGNEATLYPRGEEAFRSMFDAIAAAEDYLLVFFFIVKKDRVGERFRDALIEKAKAGVRVYFAFDQVGSRQLPQSYINTLRAGGVHVHPYRSSRGIGRLQIIFRNHRKILVVDGREAFIGGLNIGDEYLGRHPRLGPWRDTHLRLRGPSVYPVQLAFIEDWYWITREVPEVSWAPATEENPDKATTSGFGTGGQRVAVAPTGPADELDSAQILFVTAAHEARRRLWIASPYFVPDQGAVAALQAASLRGVDVRILLPGRADHLLVYLSSFAYYNDMLTSGVRIYRYRDGFMHQKVMLVDDHIAAVGTANLDNRSFRLNFEITALVDDEPFAAKVARMLEHDFSKSRLAEAGEFNDRPFWFRAACRTSRLLAPVQ